MYIYKRNEVLGVKREVFFVVGGRGLGGQSLLWGGILRHGHTGTPAGIY
jgi:hypothetical protein